MQVTELAYAKINLSLDVTAKRENGYHEIDGVMQSVSLCDEVAVAFHPLDTVEVNLLAQGNPDMPTDGRNIAVKAARLFLEAVGQTGRVEIHLVKHIPMAGGLAGGSTDAAAVLRALNRLLGRPLSPASLCALGARLGADVPFCLFGGAMRTRGIGDQLAAVPPMPPCYLVIARKGEGVSTPWAYGKLDETYSDFSPRAMRPEANLPMLLAALENGSLENVCANVYNIFEPIVAECRSEVGVLCERLRAGGALVARMSGSGPSVFGVFDSEARAREICERLQSDGAEAHVCVPKGGALQ